MLNIRFKEIFGLCILFLFFCEMLWLELLGCAYDSVDTINGVCLLFFTSG